MKKLKQLTPQEVMFIGGETANVYQHTAGLIFLDSSGRPDFCFESYRQYLEERLSHVPQFHWKLHEVPLGLDLPYWVQDESFSYDHHIKRIAVPSPGDRNALTELVSYLYARHLDRQRPLWEIWFIEGLADGNYAVFQKQHHCMMDGEGASKLFEVLSDFEPDAPPLIVDPHIEGARPGAVPEPWRMSLNAARRLSGVPVKASREIYEAVRHSVWKRLTRGGKSQERPHAPMTSFNGDISPYRGLVYGELPLAEIKILKDHFGVTVNEVILALVGSSMRDYLLARDELPEDALRTSIAISLRTAEDDEFSNKVTIAAVTLATNIADPVERIRVIAAEAEAVKEEAHSGGNKGVMEFIQILPPVMVNALLNMTPPDKVISMAGVNLVVSSVRGSSRPMYIAGAKMTSMYPMSIITPGGGINVTCVSYAGKFEFGITIEPEKVPEPWTIIDGLHKALADYLALAAGKKPARRKPAVAAKKASAQARAKPKPKPKAKLKAKAKPKAKPEAKGGPKARATKK